MADGNVAAGAPRLQTEFGNVSTRSPRLIVSTESNSSSPVLSIPSDDGTARRASSQTRPTARSLHRVARSSPSASSNRSSVQGRVTAAAWDAANTWKETVEDAWDPCILTLDGGGIRGYSSALILNKLMQEVYDIELEMEKSEPTGELPDSADKLLPCHYFDFMYGTSTGGLIAVMLARLRMNISECMEQYKLVGDRLFGARKNIIPLMTKYRSAPLEKAVQDLVADRKLGHLHPWDPQTTADKLSDRFSVSSSPTMYSKYVAKPNIEGPVTSTLHESPEQSFTYSPDYQREPDRNDSVNSNYRFLPHDRFDVLDPRVCQSCCLTAIHNNNVQQAHLLRSYPHYYDSDMDFWITPYNSGADPLEIWQVCRATSAAPFYFDMLEAEFNGEIRGHKDGGIRDNNPSGAAYSEFVSLYHPTATPQDQTLAPALLLSIGTGLTKESPDGFMSNLPFPLGYFSFFRKIAENLSVIPNLLVKYTDSEIKHINMKDRALGENTWYKRLNVSQGMEGMPLDSWVKGMYNGERVPGGESLQKMEDATMAYLKRDSLPLDNFAAPVVKLRHAAEKLVHVRRARRRQGGPRWTYFRGDGLEERMRQQQSMT